jgi:hypothetical protein
MDLLILDLMFLSADLLAAASVLPAAFSTGGEAAAVPTAVSRSVQPQKRALELGIVPFEPEVRNPRMFFLIELLVQLQRCSRISGLDQPVNTSGLRICSQRCASNWILRLHLAQSQHRLLQVVDREITTNSMLCCCCLCTAGHHLQPAQSSSGRGYRHSLLPVLDNLNHPVHSCSGRSRSARQLQALPHLHDLWPEHLRPGLHVLQRERWPHQPCCHLLPHAGQESQWCQSAAVHCCTGDAPQ